MRARVTYPEQDDPVMRDIMRAIGNEGVNVWLARQVAGVMARFERDPAAVINSDQIMQIARDACPRSREEVDAEIGGDDSGGALDVRNSTIIGAILDETANGGLLTLARFSTIILEAGEMAEARIRLAVEKAKAEAEAEYPVASSSKERIN